MTSRERFQTALAAGRPDRVPIGDYLFSRRLPGCRDHAEEITMKTIPAILAPAQEPPPSEAWRRACNGMADRNQTL